jgi:hypothetical protein
MIDQDAAEIERIREAVTYDPDTGLFSFLDRPRSHFVSDRSLNIWQARYAGKPAFVGDSNGYKCGKLFRKTLRAHRVAFALMTGRWPTEVDHINRDKSDNRWCNLREVTRHENCQNRPRRVDNKFGHTGIAFHKRMGKWQAYITADNTNHHLGTFDSRDDALMARRAAEERLHIVSHTY